MNAIALTNLGKYNEGQLVYEWLSLPFTDEELQETLENIGINEYYEEYFVSDYEFDIDYNIGEYPDLKKLNELFEEIDGLSNDELELLDDIMEQGYDLEESIEILINGDYNTIESVADDEDLGIEYIDQVYGGIEHLPRELLERYFNFESFGRDLQIDGLKITNNNRAIEIIK